MAVPANPIAVKDVQLSARLELSHELLIVHCIFLSGHHCSLSCSQAHDQQSVAALDASSSVCVTPPRASQKASGS